jgi:hypothetical protein
MEKMRSRFWRKLKEGTLSLSRPLGRMSRGKPRILSLHSSLKTHSKG